MKCLCSSNVYIEQYLSIVSRAIFSILCNIDSLYQYLTNSAILTCHTNIWQYCAISISIPHYLGASVDPTSPLVKCALSYYFPTFPFSLFLVGEPDLNIWLCLECVCGVPWMDAMLWLVNETTVHSHQCVQLYSTCVHTTWAKRGHNIAMNRAGNLAWASTLHGSPTMALSWPAFLAYVRCLPFSFQFYWFYLSFRGTKSDRAFILWLLYNWNSLNVLVM